MGGSLLTFDYHRDPSLNIEGSAAFLPRRRLFGRQVAHPVPLASQSEREEDAEEGVDLELDPEARRRRGRSGAEGGARGRGRGKAVAYESRFAIVSICYSLL